MDEDPTEKHIMAQNELPTEFKDTHMLIYDPELTGF
jgi:hypothetical protein